MKLTIDTDADTKEDLRKVIRFLQLMVNERDFRNVDQRRMMKDMQSEENVNASMSSFLGSLDTPVETAESKEPAPQETPKFKLDFF
jgi:hypothetical protein